MTPIRLASVSCDLDEIYNYCAIHDIALSELPAASAHLVYDVALARLERWSSEHGIALTLFTVGADLRRRVAAEALCGMHQKGHEIANHSFSHRYDFSRLARDDMRDEVVRASDAIAEAVGQAPVGFRAPGYIVNDAVFQVLAEANVEYDASVFPCAPYYAAKAAVMGMMRLSGRRSRSIIGSPDVLIAPRSPYRIGQRYTARGTGMRELPVQTLPISGVPFIGTTLTSAGPKGATWMTKQCLGAEFVNLELHGVDVLSAGDGLERLAQKQRDLRIPLERKLASLSRAVQTLKDAGYIFATMRDAARTLLS